MEVRNNTLLDIPFKKSPNQSGSIIPKFIIAHFTASSTAEGAISWMTDPKSKVSAHLHLDKKGDFVQLVKFNKRAYHAGKSEYKGVSDLNWHSIGIEIQNRGKVNGVYEDYTEAQIKSFIEVSKALVKAYPTITGIAGHSEIAMPRGRKDDPGPKFPMERVRREVFGEHDDISSLKNKRVTASVLNVRSGPGTQHQVVGNLSSNDEVLIMEEQNGWSRVVICKDKKQGWVSNKYLK